MPAGRQSSHSYNQIMAGGGVETQRRGYNSAFTRSIRTAQVTLFRHQTTSGRGPSGKMPDGASGTPVFP